MNASVISEEGLKVGKAEAFKEGVDEGEEGKEEMEREEEVEEREEEEDGSESEEKSELGLGAAS